MFIINTFRNKCFKIIVSMLLCFVFVFSFFAMTIEKSEAIATIPLVAIPIIKLLIACGVTFASVDAMLEVYNQIKGTTYYNTLTGNILNMLDDLSEDLVDAWVFHDWAMGDQIPPEFPEWPNLLLGSLALEIAKSDSFFQDFLNWFNGFKNDLDSGITTIIEDSFDLSEIAEARSYYYKKYYYLTGDCDVVCNIGEFSLYLRFRKDGSFIKVYLDCNAINPDTGLAFEQIYVGVCNIHPRTLSGMVKTAIFRIDSLIYEENSTKYLLGFNTCCYRSIASSSTYYTNPMKVQFNIPKDDLVLVPIEVEELPNVQINDDDNFQNDDSEEKVEIYVPIPNEIITYDPDTGLDIDFDTEISIEEFTELMTPYVGSTWEDIQQDKPIPSKVPTDVPYPEDPVVPDPVVPPAPVPDEEDLPPDAGEGDDPFAGADEEEKIDWDPLKGINLHKKFPFCIPWDLYDSFKSFNVQGKPPKWEIKYLDDTEFTIDFSIFEPWAVIVRWGLLIVFNIGLIIITRNLIRG